MEERKRSGTEISIKEVYKLLEASGVPGDHSVEFLRLSWTRNNQGHYEAFPVIEERDYSTNTHRTERMLFEDVKELIRIATIFKRFYRKELVRDAKEFNDFWIYADGNAVRMEELASELESIAGTYQKYKMVFERKRQEETRRKVFFKRSDSGSALDKKTFKGRTVENKVDGLN